MVNSDLRVLAGMLLHVIKKHKKAVPIFFFLNMHDVSYPCILLAAGCTSDSIHWTSLSMVQTLQGIVVFLNMKYFRCDNCVSCALHIHFECWNFFFIYYYYVLPHKTQRNVPMSHSLPNSQDKKEQEYLEK